MNREYECQEPGTLWGHASRKLDDRLVWSTALRSIEEAHDVIHHVFLRGRGTCVLGYTV